MGDVDILWRRQWQPTPVLSPGKSHWQRSLVGCSPWGRWELDTTEQLNFPFPFHALEKEMATHSSVLDWRIPGTGEPGGLLSMGSHRFGHDWSDLAAADNLTQSDINRGIRIWRKGVEITSKARNYFFSSQSCPILILFYMQSLV